MPGSRGIQSETSPEHRKGISLPEPHFLQHNLKGGCGTGSAMGPPSASDLPRTPEEATAQTPCNRSSRTGPWTWPFPSSVFSFCEAGRAPPALGRLVSHKMGGPQPPSQATQEALLPAAGSAAPPAPVDALGTVSPLFAPLIPICSATAQIQFWRRVPPASSPALSLRNHSNPPKQRPSNLNKPSDISLAGQDAERDSPHARRFATLGLC